MPDNNVIFTNDIKVISESIAVQFFSLFYHYFLSLNNDYIEKYHEMMKIVKGNGGKIDDRAMDALFVVVNTVSFVETKNYLNAVFIGLPRSLLEEDELLPLEEEFFSKKYPQFRQALLKENFLLKDVERFQNQLDSFLRRISPLLGEMETACKDAGAAYFRIPGKNKKVFTNEQIFNVMFRYCVGWQRLIELLRDHAKELYTIYHTFFYKGLIHKYERFYNDVKAADPQIVDSFFTQFLEMERCAYEHEFDQKADGEKPEDDQTIRDAVIRVEKFFQSKDAPIYY